MEILRCNINETIMLALIKFNQIYLLNNVIDNVLIFDWCVLLIYFFHLKVNWLYKYDN